MRLVVAAVSLGVVFAVFACGGRSRAIDVVPPPITLTPLKNLDEEAGAPDPEAADAGDRAAPRLPVRAAFVPLDAHSSANLAFDRCETIVVAVVEGEARALGAKLGAGDVALVQGGVPFSVAGDGLAVVAHVDPPNCESDAPRANTKQVVRAVAPELTWANGVMHAHLDVDPSISPNAYVGRLEGNAPVPEHTHPMSWEILCAIDASGTFTIRGAAQHLGPRGVVVVPPGVKHSWTPDPGSKFRAVQFYAPPGPEQRFRAYAAAGADAGRDAR
jgi:hypothetical protein